MGTLDSGALTQLVVDSGSVGEQAGILFTLSNHQIKGGTPARQALVSRTPSSAIAQAAKLAGTESIKDIIEHLAKETHLEDLRGCEALITLSRTCLFHQDQGCPNNHGPQVQELPAVRKRLYYLIGRGVTNAPWKHWSRKLRTEDIQHFDDVVHGLAFNSREADKILLRLAAESPRALR